MSKTTRTGGGSGQSAAKTASKTAQAAKSKVVKPETESAVKDAAAAVTGTAKNAAGVAKDQAQQAKATATEAIDVAKDEAKTQGGNIKAQAKARADEAKAKAAELTDEAKRRAHDEAEQRKTQATGAMGTTAQDLRKASEAVEENWMAKAFVTAASQIEGVTRSIDNKSPEELTNVARNAAREHPGLFLAGCFAAGVAISRTLKVAAARQPEHLYDDEGQRPQDGAYASQNSVRNSGLPNVGGHEAPEGQVGIGSGTTMTDGLGTDANTTSR